MPVYSCNRCGWETKIKTQLRNHLLRKKPCSPIVSSLDYKSIIYGFYPEFVNDYEKNQELIEENNQTNKNNLYCKFCGEVFSTKQAKSRHILSRCKVKIKKEEEAKLLQQIKEKDEIIKHQKELLEQNKITNITNNTDNSTNTTNNTTINFQINAFGNENLSYISNTFLTNLLKIPYSSIPKLLEKIHFNSEFPQNQNVKIINRKEKWALKYNGSEWEFVPKTTVINDMISNSVNILENHFEENAKDELNSPKKEKWNKFTGDYHDENPNTLKRLFDDTECLILNKSFKNKPILLEHNNHLQDDDNSEDIEVIID
jgi:hypothetical protein